MAPTSEEVDPGRVTIQRLNRFEFNNTVRDLLGVTSNPADEFPEDDFGYGFNNNGDVLSLSSLHIESYHRAIGSMLDEALAGGAPDASTERFEAENLTSSVGAANGEFWNLWSNGELDTVATVVADGSYIVRVRAAQTQGGDEDAAMSVSADGRVLETFEVAALRDAPGVFEVEATLSEGAVTLSVGFLNDYYDEPSGEDRNLYVDWIELEGPVGATQRPSSTRAEILTCIPETDAPRNEVTDCAREIVSSFGKRAWRRPLESTEVDRLVEFVDLALDEDDGFETGIRLALKATLMSPNFIFRVELDEDLDDPTPRPLSDHELASRMSYFIWSSMPDDQLMQRADEGTLQDPDVLRAEVQRMLDDPKAAALVDQFATQWLYIDAIRDAHPDEEIFPSFDEDLRAAMREETRLFVAELFAENAPLKTLLTADFTYVNDRLAEHYNTGSVESESHVRHQWEDESRRGLLGHAGLLTSTSHPTTTSPVIRGDWVLTNLLCDKPPPPPPGVEGLVDTPENLEGLTMRERFEAHSENPQCATCHRVMDPIGFGMEHYDGVGAWRDIDNGKPVDASGELPGEVHFNGPTELSRILAEHERLPMCATEKMLTYALGRGMKRSDHPQLEVLVAQTEPDHGFRDLVTAIVLSDAFRFRRGAEF